MAKIEAKWTITSDDGGFSVSVDGSRALVRVADGASVVALSAHEWRAIARSVEARLPTEGDPQR